MAAPQKTLNNTIKFLCSYAGKILPRPSDGRLRYIGGLTRVVSVHRSITFSELIEKLRELTGYDSVLLRCQLPSEDLDVLVSIKSDEDLANVIEEYDKASSISGRDLKIRAILSPPTKSSVSSSSSVSSQSSGADLSPTRSYQPRSPSMALFRRFPARKPQYGVASKFYQHYPCHLQADSRPPSHFSQYYYNQSNELN